jgi:uncharacterized protein (DUF1778 family)
MKKATIKRPGWYQTSITLTDETARLVEQAAQAHGWSIARAIRECVLIAAADVVARGSVRS